MKGDKPLDNVRQERYCQAKRKGLTDEQAYIKAGYKPKGASANVSRMIRKDRETNNAIQDRLDFLQGKTSDKHQTKVEKLEEFCDSVMLDKTQKMSDRLKAADLKGKIIGAFTTNTRISGGDGGAVVLKWKQPER